VNQFGKLLRQERKERNMTLGELAAKLKISVPYLSQIETGTKPLQEGFVERAIKTLGLIGDDANALRRAAAVSMSEFNIRLKSGASNDDRMLAAELASGFARMSPEAKERIRDIVRSDVRG
jgi:transcriptional regulator with XRE-family HTH domain